MAENLKKIPKTYVLSDSSVNVYGYRLLTSGYLADNYRRNPIGYFMHRRDEGVLLKWENIRTEGDQILAEPVVNLSHPRGQQTVDEIENGFLNAASMGRIVPIAWCTDDLADGQTGPTITKWYNKECSLVDMPGNDNALAQLYDAQDNVLNLSDLINFNPDTMFEIKLPITAELIKMLPNLSDKPDAAAVQKAIKDLADKASKYETTEAERVKLETEVSDLKKAAVAKEVKDLLDAGMKAGKLTNELVTELTESHKENPTGLKSLIDKLPAYKSVTEQLSAGSTSKDGKSLSDLSWKELDKGGYLADLKANAPEVYIQKFKEQFGKAPKG